MLSRNKPTARVHIGTVNNPIALLNIPTSAKNTRDVYAKSAPILCYIPYDIQREFAVWCAEHVYGLMLQITSTDRKNLQAALSDCRKNILGSVDINRLRQWQNKLLKRIENLDITWRQGIITDNTEPWVAQARAISDASASFNAISAIANACDPSAYKAACESLWHTCEAIYKTEARLGNQKSNRKVSEVLLYSITNHVNTAHLDALQYAREAGWPMLIGTEQDIVRGTLLRECARQRLAQILDTEELDPDNFNRFQTAISQLAENLDGKRLVLAANETQHHDWMGRKIGWNLADEAVLCRNDSSFPSFTFFKLPLE